MSKYTDWDKLPARLQRLIKERKQATAKARTLSKEISREAARLGVVIPETRVRG